MPETAVITVLVIANICAVIFAALLCRYIYADLRRQSKESREKNSEMLKMYENIEGFMDTFYSETNALKAEVAEVRANVDDVRVRAAAQMKDVFYSETGALRAELGLLKENLEELRSHAAAQFKDLIYTETNSLRSEIAGVKAGVEEVGTRTAEQVKDVFYAETNAFRAELSLLREDVEEMKARTAQQEKKERAKRGRPSAARREVEPEPGRREAPQESARDGGADVPAAPDISAAPAAFDAPPEAGETRGETKFEGVMRLYREGVPRRNIAKEMNMTKNEVDLIINLRDILPSGADA
ncbi:MAG: hypothetical protein LBD92_00735 [Oscillospiraceae bacterium]|jgi:hypothetical protein|nr:hypothetical protein [Oscillospiraceae bacterium]